MNFTVLATRYYDSILTLYGSVNAEKKTDRQADLVVG